MPKELLEFLRTKKRITNDDIKKVLQRLLEIEANRNIEPRLTDEEISEIRQLLVDKHAFGRVATIFKTAIISLAATIIAYNVFYDTISHIMLWIVKLFVGIP